MAQIQGGSGRINQMAPYTTDANGYQTAATFASNNPNDPRRSLQTSMQGDARLHNRDTAHGNFYAGQPGGQSSDPYEQAQQERNFRQTSDYKKYYDPLDPASQLKDRLGSEAYDFRKSLPELMVKQRDALTHQAGSALDQGLHNTRANMSSRGLLNSGLREGAEGSMRGRAANQLASQMAGSNAELTKMADARDLSAASAGLQAGREAMLAQQQTDDLNMQNDIRRGQAWQQLASAGGYAAGRYFGGRSPSAPSSGNQSINSSNAQGYDPDSYLNRTA